MCLAGDEGATAPTYGSALIGYCQRRNGGVVSRHVFTFTIFEQSQSIGGGGQFIDPGTTSVEITFTSMFGVPGLYPWSLEVVGDDPNVGRVYRTDSDCQTVFFSMRTGDQFTEDVEVDCDGFCIEITE